MRVQTVTVVALGLALAGCVRPSGPPKPPPAAVRTISYETSPCFGACPVFRLQVSADGKGQFTGIRNTAVTGEKPFTVTAAQFAAFDAKLRPWLPATGERIYRPGEPLCPHPATDMPSVDVHVTDPRGPRRLYFYFGCDMAHNRAMADALGNAPDALGIAALIGEQP